MERLFSVKILFINPRGKYRIFYTRLLPGERRSDEPKKESLQFIQLSLSREVISR